MSHLHRDIQSLNAVIATNEDVSRLLETQTFSIEKTISAELHDIEAVSRGIEDSIQQATEEKRCLSRYLLERKAIALSFLKRRCGRDGADGKAHHDLGKKTGARA